MNESSCLLIKISKYIFTIFMFTGDETFTIYRPFYLIFLKHNISTTENKIKHLINEHISEKIMRSIVLHYMILK